MFIRRQALAAGRRAFVVTEIWLMEYGGVGSLGKGVQEEGEEEKNIEQQ